MFAYRTILVDKTDNCVLSNFDQYVDPTKWAKKAADMKAQGWTPVKSGYSRTYVDKGITYEETLVAIPKLYV